MMRRTWLVAMLLTFLPAALGAQQRGGAPAAPPTPRAAAPVDLTGAWVSLVTNEWRWRMLTPAKGDYAVLPINNEARKIADSWDPARDEANGEQCKGYGAAVIMQMPGRARITWENDATLRMEYDAGTQTRLFRFGASQPPAGEPSWQGHSAAQWEVARGRGREVQEQRGLRTGALKVVTTRMRPGYLRKNGVPYSGNAVVTEYFSRFAGPGGDYMNVTVVVEDPTYLNQTYVRSMQFKKEPDGSKFKPEPCAAR